MTNLVTTDNVLKIKSSFNQYIVTPLNAFGLGGFVFDIEGDTLINLTAEITDHFLEDNSAVQDHIALRPQRLTLRNYVGELVYRLDSDTDTPLQKVVQKLTVISSYLPVLVSSAQQAKQAYEDLVSNTINIDVVKKAFTAPTLNNVANMWALVKNLNPNASRQQQAYMYFKALWEQRILFSVQTPFEFIPNLAIESISARQGENTRYISDFSITLKKIRTVSIANAPFDPQKYQARTEQQQELQSKNGKTEGVAIQPSLAVKIFDSFGGLAP